MAVIRKRKGPGSSDEEQRTDLGNINKVGTWGWIKCGGIRGKRGRLLVEFDVTSSSFLWKFKWRYQ